MTGRIGVGNEAVPMSAKINGIVARKRAWLERTSAIASRKKLEMVFEGIRARDSTATATAIMMTSLVGFGQSGASKTANALAAPELIDSDKGIGKEGWSIVIIPDTQNYAKYLKNQPNLDVMTEWISEHIEPWNVQAVLHEGDFVEHNAIL